MFAGIEQWFIRFWGDNNSIAGFILASLDREDKSVLGLICAVLAAVSFFIGKYFVDGDEHGCLGMILWIVLPGILGFLAFFLIGTSIFGG